MKPGPTDEFTARLAFQFYPRGGGSLNKHADPVDVHQLTVPTMFLSAKGTDFKKGGAYVEKGDGQRVCLDDLMRPGDVAYFNACSPHGVELIDPGAPLDWNSFAGRWMLLFAVNKFNNVQTIGNSVDFETKR